jgi:hypothetical protein
MSTQELLLWPETGCWSSLWRRIRNFIELVARVLPGIRCTFSLLLLLDGAAVLILGLTHSNNYRRDLRCTWHRPGMYLWEPGVGLACDPQRWPARWQGIMIITLTVRGCWCASSGRACAEQSFEPSDSGLDRFALCHASFFPERTPRDVVGQHECQPNRLPDRQSKTVVRRSEDLLEAVSTPCSHVSHLRTDGRFVEFEQGGERRTLSLVHVVEQGNELSETLSRFASRGDVQLGCVAKRLQQMRLHCG